MNLNTPDNKVFVKLSDIAIIRSAQAAIQLPLAQDRSANRSIHYLLNYLNTNNEHIVITPAQVLHAVGNSYTPQRHPAFFPRKNNEGKSVTILAQYLYYYLCYRKKQLVKNTHNGEELSLTQLSRFAIPVPPVSEQETAIALIEKKVKAVDILSQWISTEMNKVRSALNEHLAEYFASMDALQHRVSARMVPVKEAGLLQAGKTPNGTIKEYFGKEYPFYNQTCVGQLEIAAPVRYLSYRGLLQSRRVKENSVVLCFNGAQFGKAAVLKNEGAINAQLIALTPNEGIVPEYLYLQMIAPVFQQQMKAHAHHQTIGKGEFENLLIEIPPLKKQEKIVAELLSYMEVTQQKLEQYAVELEKAELSKMELLTHVFEHNATK